MDRQNRAAVFVVDTAITLLICYLAYIWASWTDPFHRAHDRARPYWWGMKLMWRISAVTAQYALALEHEYRKAIQ